MNEETRKAIATFRFQVIAPLVIRPPGPGESVRLMLDLSRRLWTTPDGQNVRIHRRTIARWVARWREHGYPGLLPEVRVDHGTRRLLPENVLQRAIELRREKPDRSVRTLIRMLELDKLVEPGQVKRSTLSHALCRAGVSRCEVKVTQEEYRRREAPYPNCLWQADTQYALRLPDAAGRRHTIYLVACLDDYSRHVAARYYPADDRPALADLLRRAILQRGLPEILYCDNGSNYKSRFLADACAELGVQLRHARPYRPQGKGKMERWFKTCDLQLNQEAQALIDHGRITTLDQAQEFLHAWLASEYNSRVHSATKECPDERLTHMDPEHPIRRVDPVTLTQAFLWKESRVVTSVGTISLEGNEYEVDHALARRKVTLRFDPFDLSHIFVEWQDKSYGEAVPLQLVRDYSRQVKAPPAPAQEEATQEHSSYLHLLQAADEARRVEQAGRMRLAPGSDQT